MLVISRSTERVRLFTLQHLSPSILLGVEPLFIGPRCATVTPDKCHTPKWR
jgi:hypothetical protein